MYRPSKIVEMNQMIMDACTKRRERREKPPVEPAMPSEKRSNKDVLKTDTLPKENITKNSIKKTISKESDKIEPKIVKSPFKNKTEKTDLNKRIRDSKKAKLSPSKPSNKEASKEPSRKPTPKHTEALDDQGRDGAKRKASEADLPKPPKQSRDKAAIVQLKKPDEDARELPQQKQPPVESSRTMEIEVLKPIQKPMEKPSMTVLSQPAEEKPVERQTLNQIVLAPQTFNFSIPPSAKDTLKSPLLAATEEKCIPRPELSETRPKEKEIIAYMASPAKPDEARAETGPQSHSDRRPLGPMRLGVQSEAGFGRKKVAGC